MKVSRPWLAVVFALFAVPLFVGLGKADLQTDEAIYSFSVDRILESGDWLVPKSSPNEDWAFLEKPPLKFWIVAAPIRLGLLPLNEFSLRVWDAVFGSAAFLYVFAIGSLLAGPVCGAVSVLVLFTFAPLLFEHGLRGNNMDAALLLAYCGGVYHYFRWAAWTDRRRQHALAVGAFFAFGFMTKFVAALFLPFVLVAGSLLVADYRRKLFRDWRVWIGVSAVAAALIAPWFIYATWKFGKFLWYMMLQEHVYTRFTHYLDPTHVQPWSYYWLNVYRSFSFAGSLFVVLAGLLILSVQTVRRRSPEGAVLLSWFWLPMIIVSMGTSKLIHYVYPFLPPLALGAGYVVALVLMLAPAPIERFLWTPREFASSRAPNVLAALRRPVGRTVLLAVAASAVAIAIASVIDGQVRLEIAGTVVFKSGGVLRPVIIVIICSALAGEGRRVTRVVVPLLVAGLLPMPAYRQTLARLEDGTHPLRTARDCLRRVEQQIGDGTPAGLYVDVPGAVMWHPIYYYFRAVRPWTRTESEQPAVFDKYLNDSREPRPILVWDRHYQDLIHHSTESGAAERTRTMSPPMVNFNDMLLLLPGPYAACSSEASGAGGAN
jgi:4-amino-4-deoxy-L-arabinose transferase-like glycosyltransferase